MSLSLPAPSPGSTPHQAAVINVDDLLSAERDENEVRKDFLLTEAVEIGALIEPLVSVPFRTRVSRPQRSLLRQWEWARPGISKPK